MHIHFVCTGNAYRSRLAEAYFKSKLNGKNLEVSSSGITATGSRLGNGPICWYAMRIMKREDLIPFMSWSERQTTPGILKEADLLVCMNNTHLEFCRKAGYTGRAEVWNIPDLAEMPEFVPAKDGGTDADHIRLTEKTYRAIVQKADRLLAEMEEQK